MIADASKRMRLVEMISQTVTDLDTATGKWDIVADEAPVSEKFNQYMEKHDVVPTMTPMITVGVATSPDGTRVTTTCALSAMVVAVDEVQRAEELQCTLIAQNLAQSMTARRSPSTPPVSAAPEAEVPLPNQPSPSPTTPPPNNPPLQATFRAPPPPPPRR